MIHPQYQLGVTESDELVGLAKCTCDRFCRGDCAPFFSRTLPPNSASGKPGSNKVVNLTLYRFTPVKISQRLADTNTGDLNGDLGFFFDRFALGDRCRAEPTNMRCFLSPWRSVVQPRGRVAWH